MRNDPAHQNIRARDASGAGDRIAGVVAVGRLHQGVTSWQTGYRQTLTVTIGGGNMARERIYETNAARVKACRERANLKTLNVQLPAELHERFEAYLKFKDVTKSDIIAKLITSQLLRKR